MRYYALLCVVKFQSSDHSSAGEETPHILFLLFMGQCERTTQFIASSFHTLSRQSIVRDTVRNEEMTTRNQRKNWCTRPLHFTYSIVGVKTRGSRERDTISEYDKHRHTTTKEEEEEADGVGSEWLANLRDELNLRRRGAKRAEQRGLSSTTTKKWKNRLIYIWRNTKARGFQEKQIAQWSAVSELFIGWKWEWEWVGAQWRLLFRNNKARLVNWPLQERVKFSESPIYLAQIWVTYANFPGIPSGSNWKVASKCGVKGKNSSIREGE